MMLGKELLAKAVDRQASGCCRCRRLNDRRVVCLVSMRMNLKRIFGNPERVRALVGRSERGNKSG
jgi:hypothetical protein